MIDGKIKSQIKKALKALEKEYGFSLSEVEVELEHPGEEGHGDYSSNIALQIYGRTPTNIKPKRPYKKAIFKGEHPKKWAEKIVEKLKGSDPLGVRGRTPMIEKIEVAGPGFINFYLSEQYLLGELKRVLDLGERYGENQIRKGKKLMVEFAHPNTLKQFHIGHMRNICLGESLVRILEASGAEVVRTNYQGDVGLHVAKALWGAKKLGLPKDSVALSERVKFLGKAYVEGNKVYESSKSKKQEIKELNKLIYLGEKSIKPLWEKTRKWSLEYFGSIYKRVYSKFDRLYFESEVADAGKKISKKALKKGVLEKSKGAVVFKGEKYGLDTRVFLTGEDLPTYEGKELGLATLEFSEFGKIDKNIHVVGPEQESFFKVTFKVEELLDPEKYKGRQKHFVYGLVRLKKGKMSSRLGNVVTGEWLLDEAKNKVSKIMDKSEFSDKDYAVASAALRSRLIQPVREPDALADDERDGKILSHSSKEKIAEMVGVGAVKYSMLKVTPAKFISFDFDESVNLEGNSGSYIQYTFARANSVLEKSKSQISNSKQSQSSKVKIRNNNWDLKLGNWKLNREELAIVRWLYRFPEVVEQAAEELAPSGICTYLYELAGRFNSFYSRHRILQSSGNQRELRLALTAAVAQVLKNGLYLLGIKAPEKM